MLGVDLLASWANGLAFLAKLFTFHNRVVRPECELFNPNTTDTLTRIILARNSQIYPVFFSICCHFMSKVLAKMAPCVLLIYFFGMYFDSVPVMLSFFYVHERVFLTICR